MHVGVDEGARILVNEVVKTIEVLSACYGGLKESFGSIALELLNNLVSSVVICDKEFLCKALKVLLSSEFVRCYVKSLSEYDMLVFVVGNVLMVEMK